MYKVFLTNKAQKDLEKLNYKIKDKILEKLKSLSQNPVSFSKKLINSDIGEYRFRIGDYRVIFDINNQDIFILRIGHRKDIYR